MARYPYQNTTKDGSGKIICSATVAVFLTGTATPASIYAASSGGVAVNSVTSGADTSSAPGYFIFWVDRSDYSADQEFDITISKSGFNTQTYSSIVIDNAADYPLLAGRAAGQTLYLTDLITKGPWVDVRAYGVNSAGFAAALAAINSTTGGTLFIPPGTYDANIVVAGKTNLKIVGGGASTIIAPASGIAIDIDGMVSGILSDFKVDAQSGTLGIDIDGDDSTEMTFNDIQITGGSTAAFRYLRTTTADSGGIYLNNVKVYKGTTNGVGFLFSGTSSVAAYLWGNGIVADGFTDHSIKMVNMFNFQFGRVYATNTHATNVSFQLDGCGQGIINSFWGQNSHASGSVFEYKNNTDKVILDNLNLVPGASGYGIKMTSMTTGTVPLGYYNLYAGTLTDDFTRIAGYSGKYTNPPRIIVTDGQAMMILEDVTTPGTTPKKYFNITAGKLQVLANDGVTEILSLTDAGRFKTVGLTLSAGTNKPTGTVTLTANAASTTVNNTYVTANSLVYLYPVTANAAADLGSATSVWISAVTAATSFVITHPNNANADKTFNYLIVN